MWYKSLNNYTVVDSESKSDYFDSRGLDFVNLLNHKIICKQNNGLVDFVILIVYSYIEFSISWNQRNLLVY